MNIILMPVPCLSDRNEDHTNPRTVPSGWKPGRHMLQAGGAVQRSGSATQTKPAFAGFKCKLFLVREGGLRLYSRDFSRREHRQVFYGSSPSTISYYYPRRITAT